MTTAMKSIVATAAASAMALTSATPAFAGDRDRHRNGPSTGEIIAGAAILGGIAVLAGAKRDRHRGYDDRRYYDRSNARRGNPRRAVNRCVRAAERDARRYGYRYADVTEIRDVDRTRYGWRVKGRIVVEDSRYRGGRDYDRGRFSCFIERGRVVDVDYRGIRGLR